MTIGLWVVQALLAFSFILHGRMMISPPAQTSGGRAQGMKYIYDLPAPFRLFIGLAEVLAAAGLILPGLTGILAWLTPLAAVGLVIVMVSALGFHIVRREYPNLVINLILLTLAVIVAYGRSVLAPL